MFDSISCGSARLTDLVTSIALRPEQHLVLVSHGNLIRELFVLFAPPSTPVLSVPSASPESTPEPPQSELTSHPVLFELREHKMESCGVVAVRISVDLDNGIVDIVDIVKTVPPKFTAIKVMVVDATFIF